MMDLSVIIVNLNTRRLLEECLASLEKGRGSSVIETIVIDNGSSDGSASMVRTRFPDVNLIQNTRNEGFARPNNQGLAAARGRYCLLLNSDTVVRPRALETMVAFMDARPQGGACGPKLLNSDGSLQRSCRNFPSLWRHFCDMSGLENLFPRSTAFGNFETRFDHDHDAEVDQPMGAALMVRAETIRQVGKLDEQFKIYYNEVDWCRRIRDAGWRIFFVNAAEIVHYGGKTTELTNRNFEQFDEMNRNCLAYYAKHLGYAGMVLYRILLIAGFSFRVVLWEFVSLWRNDMRIKSRLLFAKKFLALGLRFWERPREVIT